MSPLNNTMRTFVNSFILNLSALAIASSCALPAPPDGGPRDTDGPKVVESNLALGATSSNPEFLSWTFDEYVVLNLSLIHI